VPQEPLRVQSDEPLDRAGNNLQRLFDEEVMVAARDTATIDFVEVPFTARRSSTP
jgi:hypothetical protein